jgi:hypothetical protein
VAITAHTPHPIATHKEDVSADELARRAEKFFGQYQAEHKKAA